MSNFFSSLNVFKRLVLQTRKNQGLFGKGLKTLYGKEKLLITSNFSFSHSVFYLFVELCAIYIKFEIVVCKLFQFGRVQNLSFGKRLILQENDRLVQSIMQTAIKMWLKYRKFVFDRVENMVRKC